MELQDLLEKIKGMEEDTFMENQEAIAEGLPQELSEELRKSISRKEAIHLFEQKIALRKGSSKKRDKPFHVSEISPDKVNKGTKFG